MGPYQKGMLCTSKKKVTLSFYHQYMNVIMLLMEELSGGFCKPVAILYMYIVIYVCVYNIYGL